MTLASFPVLPGIGWDIKKTPILSTRVLTAANGLEYRAQNWTYPRWKFSIPIPFMRQYLTYTEQQTLIGFILSQGGQFNSWAYNDPFDNNPVNQLIGSGNGSQLAFPLVRTIGGFTEPVLYCPTLTSVSVGGSVVSSSTYSLTQSGSYGNDTITFNAPPANGVAILATFVFNFVCRFLSDENEFNNDLWNIWSMKSIDFESIK